MISARPSFGNTGRILSNLVAVGIAGIAAIAPASVRAQASAVAPDWAKVVAAAQTEGKVVVYGTMVPPVGARLKADFEKLHPNIVVEYSRPGSTALVAKVEAERATKADGADLVVFGERPWLEEQAKAGVLRPATGPSAKAWPASHLFAGIAPMLSVEPLVISYNPNLVKTPVTGYQDLLRPEFKGKLGTMDVQIGTIIIAWYDWLERTQGPDFLARFAAQQPRFLGGAAPLAQSVVSGELSATAFNVVSVAIPMIEQGAPLKMVVPNPAIGAAYIAGLLNWARRPNAALVFTDYLMSPRGQEVWNGKGEGASPLPGIKGSIDPKSIAPWDYKPWNAATSKAYIEKWNKVFRAK